MGWTGKRRCRHRRAACATTSANTGWGGPCPPAGDPPHHYVFTLYALDTARLPVASGASHRELRQALRRHALASAAATLLYGR